MNLRNSLRIYRTWSWKIAVPASEIRYGGKNPMQLVAHDELQFFSEASGEFAPIPIIEAEKPEHPDEKEDRKRNEEISRAMEDSLPEIEAALARSREKVDQKRCEEMQKENEESPEGLVRADKINKTSSFLTTDPTDPALGHGSNDTPVPMNEKYLILSKEERAKGLIRPVRRDYTHSMCGNKTYMGLDLAETYARDPKFYGSTYCASCNMHRPVEEFKWLDGERVGS
jgi:hypothetical protein